MTRTVAVLVELGDRVVLVRGNADRALVELAGVFRRRPEALS